MMSGKRYIYSKKQNEKQEMMQEDNQKEKIRNRNHGVNIFLQK